LNIGRDLYFYTILMLSAKIQKEAPGCASGGCEKGHARARARYVEERVQERDVGVRDARERVCGGRGGASSSGVCEWFEHVRQNKMPYSLLLGIHSIIIGL